MRVINSWKTFIRVSVFGCSAVCAAEVFPKKLCKPLRRVGSGLASMMSSGRRYSHYKYKWKLLKVRLYDKCVRVWPFMWAGAQYGTNTEWLKCIEMCTEHHKATWTAFHILQSKLRLRAIQDQANPHNWRWDTSERLGSKQLLQWLSK